MKQLKAIELGSEICVKDMQDGVSVWTPNADAAAEITQAADPKAKAVEICQNEPMRGQWKN